MKIPITCFIFIFHFFCSAVHAEQFSKHVLVAGGAGFLGSHMCDRLVKEGASVICIDNLYSGSLDNIQHLLSHPQFVFVKHDITNPYDPEIALDEIYNFACPASPIHYQRYPIQTFLSSVLGSYNLLELAKKNNAKIFQSSTSEIYGDPILSPQVETHWGNVNPIGIRSCYDEGKRGAESLFFDYHRQYGVRIKVGRIFNTFGPKMHKEDGRVVSNFIVQALLGQPLTIYGQGLQTRSFCYVDDLLDAITLLMATSDEITGPINLGNPSEYTVLDFAQMIIQMTHSTSDVVFKPLPGDDPKQRRPDISLAKKVLNWEPKISVEEGVQKTITYFTEVLAN